MAGPSLKFDRRKFLTIAGAIGVAGALEAFREASPMFGAVPSNGSPRMRAARFVRPKGGNLIDNYPSELYIDKLAYEIDLISGSARTIECSVPAHVVETLPQDSNFSILASKKADRISFVDWQARREIAVAKLADQQYFYGHAVFTDDGRHVIAPIISKHAEGSLGVFELPSLRQVSQIPIVRGVAHEILPLGDNHFLFAVGNKGNQPGAFAILNYSDSTISYIDSNFGSESDSVVISHIHKSEDRFFATANAILDGSLGAGTILNFDKAANTISAEIPFDSQIIQTEALSLAYRPETKNLWITLPAQDLAIIWDTREQRLVRKIEFAQAARPTAISYVPETDTMLITTRAQFFAFDAKTGQQDEDQERRLPHRLLSPGCYCAHSRRINS